MDQSPLKKDNPAYFIFFFFLGINLSPFFFSACTGTREHMSNTLPGPKRDKGPYARELAALIKM